MAGPQPQQPVKPAVPSTAPDFTHAIASSFGFEHCGFGVADNTTGCFDRGESFTLQSTRSFTIKMIH